MFIRELVDPPTESTVRMERRKPRLWNELTVLCMARVSTSDYSVGGHKREIVKTRNKKLKGYHRKSIGQRCARAAPDVELVGTLNHCCPSVQAPTARSLAKT